MQTSIQKGKVYSSHLSTWLVTTIIFLLTILVRLKETKCIPNKMRKITSASAKMSLLTLSSTKVKKLTSRMSFTLIKASSSWLLFSKGTEKVFMDKIKLVSRKGVYPYDYTHSITKFDVTELPPKDKFYSKLNDCDISNEDYEHTQNLWN